MEDHGWVAVEEGRTKVLGSGHGRGADKLAFGTPAASIRCVFMLQPLLCMSREGGVDQGVASLPLQMDDRKYSGVTSGADG